MTADKFHVAIIGGGLCGLALALALEQRGVAYTIYERQAAFAEIGAGLNVAPNAVSAFNLICPSLGAAVLALASPNAPDPDVWMVNRLGAPTERFPDGHLVARIVAPGVGHAAMGRYELLNLLASKIDPARARLGKKLARVEQHDAARPGGHSVTLVFEDGTTDEADVVIGCDGIHSTVRQWLLGPQDIRLGSKFTGIAGYRAIIPMDKLEEAIGPDAVKSSCVFGGPGGYVIMYSIEGGTKMNVGMWRLKEEYRDQLADRRWVLEDQRAAMLEDFKDWGPTIHKVMDLMGEETQLWTSHHHDMQLESYFDGRICVIGDAAHSMGPHQGQGASQAMEDAYVMAEVLSQINSIDNKNIPLSALVDAAFRGWQNVRKPQFEWVQKASYEGFGWWAGLWRSDLTQQDVEDRAVDANVRFSRLWNSNVERQGEVAKSSTLSALKGSREGLLVTV